MESIEDACMKAGFISCRSPFLFLLNFFASPFPALEVPPCQGDQGNAVNVFGKPTESYIRLEPDDSVINDSRVNGQGNHFHDESRLGIACAGYGVEQNE